MRDVLDQAADLIEAPGHCRGSLGDPRSGAISVPLALHLVTDGLHSPEFVRAENALADRLGLPHRVLVPAENPCPIARWSDETETGEVLRAMRGAS